MTTMNLYFCHTGACCAWPMEAYDPADLPPEDHTAIREKFVRDAIRDGIGPEEAEEVGSQFYLHWLGRDWGRRDIPRGDHARAYFSVRAYARRSAWHGFTGNRRQSRSKRIERGSDGLPVKRSVAKVAAGEIQAREQARARAAYTPASVAESVERIANSPALGRKAYRLAKRLGLPGVRELVREACGFSD
jgi:hypothetical protein